MRRFWISLTAAALIVAFVPAFAGAQTSKPVTVTGKLLDYACFLAIGAAPSRDAELVACSMVGAQKGERLALLTPGGVFYFVRGPLADNNNAKLVPYIAKVIQLTGVVTSVDTAPVLAPAATLDPRRTAVSDNEVIEAPPPRGPDYREGDPRVGIWYYIDATTGLDIVTKTKIG